MGSQTHFPVWLNCNASVLTAENVVCAVVVLVCPPQIWTPFTIFGRPWKNTLWNCKTQVSLTPKMWKMGSLAHTHLIQTSDITIIQRVQMLYFKQSVLSFCQTWTHISENPPFNSSHKNLLHSFPGLEKKKTHKKHTQKTQSSRWVFFLTLKAAVLIMNQDCCQAQSLPLRRLFL